MIKGGFLTCNFCLHLLPNVTDVRGRKQKIHKQKQENRQTIGMVGAPSLIVLDKDDWLMWVVSIL